MPSLWDYVQEYPGRLRDQFTQGMQQFAETRNPVAALSALNPTTPFIQDAALQGGGLIAPHANQLGQAVSQSSENLGLGPLAIPEVTDEQLAPLLMLGMGNPSKMGFFSPSGKALTTAPGKGTSQQYLAHLKKEPGATKEAKQTGLIQRLEEAPGTLTREEVVSMWNPIELTETVKTAVDTKGAANLDSPFAIPEVMRAARNAVNADDLALTIANDGDAFRALERQFPNLTDQDDWDEIVVRDIWGKQDQPANVTRYGNDERLNLPGGEGPKEILVQLPDKGAERLEKIDSRLRSITTTIENAGDMSRYDDLKPEVKASVYEQRDKLLKEQANLLSEKEALNANPLFRGGHWDEPNVLAHIRTNKRDVGGVSALHAEEFQSDWHQQGQKKGYGTSMSVDERIRLQTRQMAIEHLKYELGKNRDPQTNRMVEEGRWHELSSEHEQIEATLNNDDLSRGKVPDAPFKKDWHELSFKRFLMEGINDPSVDRITWTSGDVQADRYNLAKYIDSIEAQAVGDNFNLAVTHKDGHTQNLQNVTPDKLSDYVGKEMAEKIVSDVVAPNYGVVKTSQGYEITVDGELEGGWYDSEKEAQHAISQYEAWEMEGSGGKPATYSGLDLQVGGEFHKQLYDKKIPQFAKKFLKKYGVEPQKFDGSESAEVQRLREELKVVAKNFPNMSPEELIRASEIREAIQNKSDNNKYWYIDITPEMRQDLQEKGVPLAMNDRKPLLAYA